MHNYIIFLGAAHTYGLCNCQIRDSSRRIRSQKMIVLDIFDEVVNPCGGPIFFIEIKI